MAYWLIAETPENWEHDSKSGFKYFGLPEHKRSMVTRLDVGDLLIVYVTKVSCFADTREVISKDLLRLKGDAGYDFPFQFAIQTRPVITPDKEKWIKAKDVVDKLTMTKNLTNKWQLAFRQSMRQLSEEDGELLRRLLEARSR
jgi:predicted RNA-binding protein